MLTRFSILLSGVLLASFFSLGSGLLAQELRFAVPVKAAATTMLTDLADERGLWKEAGIKANWTAFDGGVDMDRAVAAGRLDMGVGSIMGIINANAKMAAPIQLMVANTGVMTTWQLYVRGDSPIKGPKDLKGAKISMTRLYSTPHAYAQAVAKSVGLQKEVKYMAAGGVPARLAAIKSGAIDVTIGTYAASVQLILNGVIREIANMRDYLPKPWADYVLYSRPEYTKTNPEMVRRAIKVILAAGSYLQENPQWLVDYLKRVYRFSPDASVLAQKDLLAFGERGRLNAMAIRNVAEFMAEYDLAPKEKLGLVEQWFTNAFVE